MKKLLLILILLAFPASAVAEYKPPPKQPGPYVGDTIKGAEFTWLGEPYCEIGFPGLPGCKGTISSHWLRCPAGSCEPIQEGSLSYKVVQADLGSEMWFYTASKGTEADGSTFAATAFNSKYEAVKSHGTVYWEGGGVTNRAYQQWSEVDYSGGATCQILAPPTKASLENTHLKEETTGFSATAGVGRALLFKTFGNDAKCYEHIRSELANFGARGFKPGDEVWFAWEVSPGATSSPGILPQWHAKGGCGNPPVSVDMATDGTKRVEVSTRKVPSAICETGNDKTKLTAKMNIGAWTKIVTRIKFAETETGEVEVFVNGVKELLKTSERTVGEGEVKTRIGLYTDEASEVYTAGFTAASTQEAAELNAFHPH